MRVRTQSGWYGTTVGCHIRLVRNYMDGSFSVILIGVNAYEDDQWLDIASTSKLTHQQALALAQYIATEEADGRKYLDPFSPADAAVWGGTPVSNQDIMTRQPSLD